MSQNKKYSAVHYSQYLELEKILNAQNPRSKDLGDEAHEEMLFIIIHQAYELWFKQILHEVNSVMNLFSQQKVDENNMGIAVLRLERVNEILKLLIQQVKVLETMTPLDFLDFRAYLFPASGFQSFQFRKFEVSLGLKMPQRHSYTAHAYYKEFDEQEQQIILNLEKSDSLFDLIEHWLERTPFLDFPGFHFKEHYMKAVENMLGRERSAIEKSDYLNPHEKEMRLKMNGDSNSFFANLFDPEYHQKQIEAGNVRLSYKATIAALLIQLYRDEPILQMPYKLLTNITEMDSNINTWRYRHAQMVMQMLGRKTGTGGSSGHEYLMETVKKHQIFLDFHNISTLLIPRSELPVLPAELKKSLGFHFNYSS